MWERDAKRLWELLPFSRRTGFLRVVTVLNRAQNRVPTAAGTVYRLSSGRAEPAPRGCSRAPAPLICRDREAGRFGDSSRPNVSRGRSRGRSRGTPKSQRRTGRSARHSPRALLVESGALLVESGEPSSRVRPRVHRTSAGQFFTPLPPPRRAIARVRNNTNATTRSLCCGRGRSLPFSAAAPP